MELQKLQQHLSQDNEILVPRKINPADHGTRGLFLTYLKEKWLSAPEFLQKTQFDISKETKNLQRRTFYLQKLQEP